MARLTVEQAKREAGSAGTLATSLNLSHRALSDVSCLSSFMNLERLDLGYNCLVTLEGLSTCTNLKWFSVIENKLVSLKGVEVLSKLQVLNVGKNKLKTMDEVKSLTSLGALILNDNNISSICKLDQLHRLNTLALSKNPIFALGDALMKATAMKKTIPSDMVKNVKILNLDLGNNLIERRSDLEGNPNSEKDGLAKKVKKSVPNLRIFNLKPMEASSKSKNSREENLPINDANMPDDGPTDIYTKKKGKGKHSKQQIMSPEEPVGQSTRPDVTIATPIKSELLNGKEIKKEKAVVEHVKNKKSNRKDDNSSLDDTDKKVSKGAKRMKSADKEEKNAEGIDDTEMPFADLMFSSDGNNPEALLKGKKSGNCPRWKIGWPGNRPHQEEEEERQRHRRRLLSS